MEDTLKCYSQYAEQWVEEQYKEKGISEYDPYGRLLSSIAKQAVLYASKHALNAQGLRNELEEADNLISGVQQSLRFGTGCDSQLTEHLNNLPENGESDSKQKAIRTNLKKLIGHIWDHHNPQKAFLEGWTSLENIQIDLLSLDGCIGWYINHKWLRSTYLEWVFIDAIIFQEIIAYGETVKENYSEPMWGIYIDNRGRWTDIRKAKEFFDFKQNIIWALL